MDAAAATPLAAFAVGVATSLHCAGMCGPLACAVRARPLEYHLKRLISYTAAGALCGAAGQVVVEFFRGDTVRFVPWALAAVLMMIGFGLEKRLPQPRWLAALLLRARLNRSLGWLTPLLPCGPLWLMFAAAAITGSWLSGALHLAAFVAGTVPLYWLLQAQVFRAQSRFTPALLGLSQRALAFISAALLVWRALLPAYASCH
jgi:sulfite exporter TauE/SafE